MILCLCRGVSDRAVRGTIHGGASTLDEVVAACRAGSDCGACQDALLDLLDEARRHRDTLAAPAVLTA